MGRRIEIEPGWLVSPLVRWAVRDIPGRELGYASGSSWMRGLKSSPATCIADPTGFSAQDLGEIEAGMAWLHDAYQPAWASVMMYYKPWTIVALKGLGFPFADDRKQTYYDRLHDGHARLAARLNAQQAARKESLQKRLDAPASAVL